MTVLLKYAAKQELPVCFELQSYVMLVIIFCSFTLQLHVLKGCRCSYCPCPCPVGPLYKTVLSQ